MCTLLTEGSSGSRLTATSVSVYLVHALRVVLAFIVNAVINICGNQFGCGKLEIQCTEMRYDTEMYFS